MVLIDSGPEGRGRIEREWADPSSVFLFSGRNYTTRKLAREFKTGRPLILEDRARTTDQNARYSAPLIRKTGAKSVVLALPWYHLAQSARRGKAPCVFPWVILGEFPQVPRPLGVPARFF